MISLFYLNHLLVKFNIGAKKQIIGLSPAVMELFFSNHWPGNIRELKSVLEYSFVIAKDDFIETDQLPTRLLEHSPKTETSQFIPKAGNEQSNNNQEMDNLTNALKLANGNKVKPLGSWE